MPREALTMFVCEVTRLPSVMVGDRAGTELKFVLAPPTMLKVGETKYSSPTPTLSTGRTGMAYVDANALVVTAAPAVVVVIPAREVWITLDVGKSYEASSSRTS